MSHKSLFSSHHTGSQQDTSVTVDASKATISSKNPQGQVIKTLSVRPGQQSHVPLGVFTEAQPLKGFLVELDPDPNPDSSVITKVLRVSVAQGYTLTLHIANFGRNTVTAAVRQL